MVDRTRLWLAAAAAVLATSPAASAGPPGPHGSLDALVAQATQAMLQDPRQADAIARQLEARVATLADARASRRARATALWLRAEAHYRMDDIAGAAPLIAGARQLILNGEGDTKLRGDILLTSGSIHGARTEAAAAMVDFQRAHGVFTRIGELRGQAITLVCLSTLYKDAKDYLAALRYLQEALDAYPADPKLALTIHNNRGVILQKTGRYREADTEFAAAARLAVQIDSRILRIQLILNQARNALFEGRLAVADRLIASAQRLAAGTGDDATLLAVSAQAALQHRRTEEAARLIERAFAGADLTRTPMMMREAHQTAFDVFRARRQTDRALAHLTALKRLDDESTRLATETGTALLAARFDSANQDAKIQRLRDAERLRVAGEALSRARSQRTVLLVLGAAGAIIMAMLSYGIVALRRSRKRLRAARDGLRVTNGALEKALAAKTEFLATTSHEIRTPLNGILGMTQVMLADRGIVAATRDRLTVVHAAGVAMRGLVDDILDVAKMETGRLTLDPAPFDLARALREVAAMWTDQARDKGLTFDAALGDCPSFVSGDAGRVRQIVNNLLSNALKFSETGGVRLSAECHDGVVRIAVADTGIGIPLDKQATVFEPFQQADASTTRRFGGTGLGLSICRNLVRAMGGDIAVTGAAGVGSIFTVTLPLPRICAPAVVAATPAGGPGLLIVDRNPISRATLRTVLAPHVDGIGFAATLDDVAAAIAAGGVACILVDDATARAGGDPVAFVSNLADIAGDVPTTLLWPVAAAVERAELDAMGLAVIAKPITGAALVRAMFPHETADATNTELVSQSA